MMNRKNIEQFFTDKVSEYLSNGYRFTYNFNSPYRVRPYINEVSLVNNDGHTASVFIEHYENSIYIFIKEDDKLLRANGNYVFRKIADDRYCTTKEYNEVSKIRNKRRLANLPCSPSVKLTSTRVKKYVLPFVNQQNRCKTYGADRIKFVEKRYENGGFHYYVETDNGKRFQMK